MVGQQIEAIAKDINEWNDMYCLGYGATYPIALEGALKLKEITYAHCEGMLSTEFKHGPLSAVSKGFPIIFSAGPNDVPLIISGINEVKVRGARTITIAEDDARLRANGDDLVVIPKSDAQISALLGVLPLQLLSYHMSVRSRFPEEFVQDADGGLVVNGFWKKTKKIRESQFRGLLKVNENLFQICLSTKKDLLYTVFVVDFVCLHNFGEFQ
jgi:hypothetical protein